MDRGRGICLVLLVLGLGFALPLHAQLRLNLVGFEPPVAVTALDRVTVVYDCTSTAGGAVTVSFFRDDGLSVEAAGILPGTGPFQVVMPLPTGVDGRRVSVQAVARQEPGNEIVPGNRTLSIVVDDTGPGSIVVDSPVFPVESFEARLELRGRVGKGTGFETGGRVELRRADGDVLLGGGAIRADGRFLAAVDLQSLPLGLPVILRIRAFDGAGNGGAVMEGRVTRQAGGTGSLSDLELSPPDGSIVSAPGLRIRGRVTGPHGPYQVGFLVNGIMESSLTGLASGTVFAHMLNLPGEGSHSLSLRLQRGLQVIETKALGLVTLDRSLPSAPRRDETLRRRFIRLHGLVP